MAMEGCLDTQAIHLETVLVEEQAHRDHQGHRDPGILHLRDHLDLLDLQDHLEEEVEVEAVDHQVVVADAVTRGRYSPWHQT